MEMALKLDTNPKMELEVKEKKKKKKKKEEEKKGDKEKEEEENIDLEGLRPTSKHRKLASKQALKVSLQSGLYPEYLGIEGPYLHTDPRSNNELDFLTMLWPQTLYDLIVEETNRYARRKRHHNWIDVTRSDVLWGELSNGDT